MSLSLKKIKKIQALDRKATKTNQKQISDSFFTVQLLFKCRFVAWQRGLSWKITDCVFVLINSVLLNLSCVWMVFQLFLVSQYHDLTFRFGCHEWCHQRGGRSMRPTLRPGPVTMAKRLENSTKVRWSCHRTYCYHLLVRSNVCLQYFSLDDLQYFSLDDLGSVSVFALYALDL